jgi:hypothetical protein
MLVALLALSPSAIAQSTEDMPVPSTMAQPTPTVVAEPELEPAAPTPQPVLTNAQPEFNDTGLSKARARAGYSGGAIGLGSLGVVLAYFVGPNSCYAQDNICSNGRIYGLVVSGTVLAGGLLGMIPAGIALRREKKARDARKVVWDPDRGQFAF